jgi:hypothetical protein
VGTTLGPAYEKTWPRYNPEGTLKKSKTREVNNILQPTENENKEMAFSVTEASDEEADKKVVVGVESEMRTFLRKVAVTKKLKVTNVKSWMDALIYKLDDIRMSTVSDVRKDIITLNRKLNDKGHSMLHTKTLIVFF